MTKTRMNQFDKGQHLFFSIKWPDRAKLGNKNSGGKCSTVTIRIMGKISPFSELTSF